MRFGERVGKLADDYEQKAFQTVYEVERERGDETVWRVSECRYAQTIWWYWYLCHNVRYSSLWPSGHGRQAGLGKDSIQINFMLRIIGRCLP